MRFEYCMKKPVS